MTVDSNTRAHAQRVDACLRRLLDALTHVEGDIEGLASARYGESGRLWQRLRDAIADAEPWPLELLGPVMVASSEIVEGRVRSKQVPAWFSRGHHTLERFQLFAKSEARRRGFALASRPGMPTQQGFQAYFLPPDPAAGRLDWTHSGPGTDGVVPVTVWTPAEDTNQGSASGAVPPRTP